MKKTHLLLLGCFVLLSMGLLCLGTGVTQGMQAKFLAILGPFLKTGFAVQQSLGVMEKGLKSLEQLEEENVQLYQENRKLQATAQILRDLESENNHLRQALEYRQRSVFRLVPAQIIARDASTWWDTVKINRGFEDGVEAEYPVITEYGVVGKTMTVSKNESIVMLVTDENCKIGAYVAGTHEKGIAGGVRIQQGTAGELQMNFLSKNAHLLPGQKIYSQGVGGVFPPGLLVGVVKSFRARELDGQALLDPAVDFSSLADVFVIVGKK